MFILKKQIVTTLLLYLIFLGGCENCDFETQQGRGTLDANLTQIMNDPSLLWSMKEDIALKRLKELCSMDSNFCLKQNDHNASLLKNALNQGKFSIADFLIDQALSTNPSFLMNSDNSGHHQLYYIASTTNPPENFLKNQIAKFSKEQLETKDTIGLSFFDMVFRYPNKEALLSVCEKFPTICDDEDFIYNKVTTISTDEEIKIYLLEKHPGVLAKKDANGNNIFHKIFNGIHNFMPETQKNFREVLLNNPLSKDMLLAKNLNDESPLEIVIKNDWQNLFLEIINQYPELINYKLTVKSSMLGALEYKTINELYKEGLLPEGISKVIKTLSE